jgi:hypothetical protein
MLRSLLILSSSEGVGGSVFIDNSLSHGDAFAKAGAQLSPVVEDLGSFIGVLGSLSSAGGLSLMEALPFADEDVPLLVVTTVGLAVDC